MNFNTAAALYILLDDWYKKVAAEQQVTATRRETEETRHDSWSRSEPERYEQAPAAPSSNADEQSEEAGYSLLDDWPWPFFPERLPERPKPEPYFYYPKKGE